MNIKSRSKLTKKIDQLVGAGVRARGYCQMATKDNVKCGGDLQWCHIVGRANRRLRWEEYNALCLCAGHHVYYTMHPWEWREIIQLEFKDHFEFIQAHRNEIYKPTKVELQEKINQWNT